MKKRLVLFFLLLLTGGLFLFSPKDLFSQTGCQLYRGCNNGICEVLDYECCSVPEANQDCALGVVCSTPLCSSSQPNNVCCRPGVSCPNGWQTWTYAHSAQCVVDRHIYSVTGGIIGVVCAWEWQQQNCSAADRCGPCVGSQPAGESICAGICNDTGCASGGWYKTCCQVSGSIVAGARLSGVRGSCTGNGGCSGTNVAVVRWGDFRSPGPSCSNDLCLGIFDGFSWTVNPCGTTGGEIPIVMPTPPGGTSDSGSTCGPTGYRECWGYGGCGAGPCERLRWGMFPHGNCTPCFNVGWDLGCGSCAPARPSLNLPAEGTRISTGGSLDFSWWKFQGGEPTCDRVDQRHYGCSSGRYIWYNDRFCWGYQCARGGYGISLNTRRYGLFVSRVKNLTRAQAESKTPAHWEEPERTIVGGEETLVRDEIYSDQMRYSGSDTITRSNVLSISRTVRDNGVYWWFVRACNNDGCTDSELRSFNITPPPTCIITGNLVAVSGEPAQYCVTTENADLGGGIFSAFSESPLDNANSWTRLRPIEPITPPNNGCVTHTFLQPGTYHVICNARSLNEICTGNPACPWGASPISGFTCDTWRDCTNNDSILVTVRPPAPWFQTQGGNVHGGNVASRISRLATNRFFSLGGVWGQSGLVSARSHLPTSQDNFNGAQVSQGNTNWQIRGSLSALRNRYHYSHFISLLDVNEANEEIAFREENILTNPVSLDRNIVVYSSGDGGMMNINGWAIGDVKKIIFVAGDLNINDQITVGPSGFLAVIVSGDLTIDVGTMNLASTTPQVQGVFLVDGQITTVKNDAESKFVGEGVFFSGTAFSLNKDLEGGNTFNPAELFIFNPRHLFNAPEFFRSSHQIWQEIAP